MLFFTVVLPTAHELYEEDAKNLGFYILPRGNSLCEQIWAEMGDEIMSDEVLNPFDGSIMGSTDE